MEVAHCFKRCTTCSFEAPKEFPKLPAVVRTAYEEVVQVCTGLVRASLFTRLPKLAHLQVFVDVPNMEETSRFAGGEFTRETMG